ncbi:MAG TPA: ABC transporter permease, partial [Thermoanaerobaculia bacterium]|nr:ABC transporter permease [Thermoanaerobaculia bacterium]
AARTGQTVSIPTPRGRRDFRVAGVYRDYSNDRGTVILDRDLYLSIFDDHRVTSVAVLAAPGVDVGELRQQILKKSEGRYALSVSTNRDLRRAALEVFDQTFAVTRALETIAICVAILGVANALAASVIERRRAFGLLRAVGAMRGQIRGAVLVEASLSGVSAAVLSIGAAAAFSYLLLAVINPQSFGWTVVWHLPSARLAAVLIIVTGAAVLAGVLPGRLASSIDPAAALAEE